MVAEASRVQTGPLTQYNVGGILLARPFKIRRLGHFGFNVQNMDQAFTFYTDLLGFRVSDERDDAGRVPPEERAAMGNTRGYFMHYGGDHHAFVLYNKRTRDADPPKRMAPGVTINQITWQVGSLAEVVNGNNWFQAEGHPIRRSGRDMPGSNWHTYLWDPDGNVDELYYGMEQIGWNGYSKPSEMHKREFRNTAPLPQISEQQEVEDAVAEGVNLLGGYRYVDRPPATFDVDGILLPRPFKIVRIGPVSLFVNDMAQSESFYTQTLGFTLTEEVVWDGERCVFLRANTEHHSLALYPVALRERLGLSPHTLSFALGLQLANYRQLKDAHAFLVDHGCRTINLPREVHPGIDYAVHVLDPDGHTIQLYCEIEQIGWDGRPRSWSQRRQVQPGVWPEALTALADSFGGEPYLGPWG